MSYTQMIGFQKMCFWSQVAGNVEIVEVKLVYNNKGIYMYKI